MWVPTYNCYLQISLARTVLSVELEDDGTMGRSLKCRVRTAGMALALAASSFVFGGQAADTQAAKPDNTKVNKRDRAEGARTADQQKMNSSDREITRKIRQAIYKDKSLSTYAHNVKIITRDGAVTLKGPVRSEEEKKNVEAKAAEVAGGKVTSEVEVVSKGSKTKKKES